MRGGAATGSSLPLRSTHTSVRAFAAKLPGASTYTSVPSVAKAKSPVPVPFVASRDSTGTAVPSVSRRFGLKRIARSVPAAR